MNANVQSLEEKEDAISNRWKPYEGYREARTTWGGMVPKHWHEIRMRFVCRINPSRSEVNDLPPDTEVSFLPMEKVSEDGQLTLDETRSMSDVKAGFTYFRDGDVLVAKITPCFENGKGGLCKDLKNGIGFGTTEFHVCRPDGNLDGRFLFYLTKSHPFRSNGETEMKGTAGQKRVTDDYIRNVRFGVPPLSEQRAIADFLDRETAKLDALIAEKEKLIKLLEEKRMAAISRAVTKGINPDVKMKDSGIPWLGRIPEHWAIVPGKRVWSVVASGTDSASDGASAIPLVKVDDLNRGSELDPVESANSFVTRSMQDIRRRGTDRVLLFPKRGAAIFANKVRLASMPLETDPNLMALRINRDDADSLEYYQWVLLCRGLDDIADVSSVPQINNKHIYPCLIPRPPCAEQRAIDAQLRQGVALFLKTINVIRDSLELLRERRTALISAAVTGKIDVRSYE